MRLGRPNFGRRPQFDDWIRGPEVHPHGLRQFRQPRRAERSWAGYEIHELEPLDSEDTEDTCDFRVSLPRALGEWVREKATEDGVTTDEVITEAVEQRAILGRIDLEDFEDDQD